MIQSRSCTEGCGACCDPVVLQRPKRQLLSEASIQPTPDAFRAWARRLIPIGRNDNGYLFACPQFDRATRRCRAYDDRPWICSAYPWYSSGPSSVGDVLERLPRSCSFIGETLVDVAGGG